MALTLENIVNAAAERFYKVFIIGMLTRREGRCIVYLELALRMFEC